MHRKMLSCFFALAVATGAFLAQAEVVGEDVARAAAEGFLAKSAVAKAILSGRRVDSVESRGSLWIVRLAPSGYIEVAGSTKCAPILSFSSQDFAEPEVGSPLVAKLSADNRMVENKEADESLEDNADWAKYTAPAAKKRTLLSAKPTGTDGTGYTPYVAPLLGATWHQTAPYNDLSPYNYFCGCMATAAGQEIRYWRWPYRYEKIRQTTHGVRDAQFNYSDFVIRPNGLVPFDWNKVKANYTDEANASTPWANDKKATYNAAWLSLWMQSLTGMGYKPGGSGGTRQLASTAEEYWYESGRGYTYWNDGYEALWAAVKADLDWGSPIQVNTAAHQMVIDGYAVENYGTDDEVDWINLNVGYGYTVYWENLKTAVTEGTYSGVLATFQTGFRPQKIVQFEPIPKVSGTSLTLAWHIAPCYTNKISGFFLQTSKNGTSAGGGMIPSLGDTTERYTYDVTGLENGSEYTFTVTPLMNEGEGIGRANSVTTTIGEPKAAPEFLSVSSVACGIELLQQDIFIECAYGSVNKIDLTCSESTTEVVPYSSHLTILPDNKLSVTKVGNVFTVNVDATAMDPKWSGEMLVLTLVAKNGDGTEAYKNLMLRFNSMRNVLGGTFEIVETSATSPVWFAGGTTTTLDAKGKAVTFASGAVNGTGTIILTNGSFTFEGLNGFTGTLKWAPSVTVNLPADMSNFAGTLWFEQWGGTYHLARSLGSRAKVYIGGNTQLFIDNNVTVDAAITGSGYIMVVGSAPTFGNLSGFTGHISLGDFDNSGTVTIPAGQEKGVVIDNGTVNLILSKAQVSYGYSTTEITMQGWGSVVFKDESGNVLQSWNSSQSSYSIASSANTWTPDPNTGTGNFWDAARWSQGLPSAGDYVIFNDTVGDSEMTLNLSSDFNLGYVLVTGTKLKISAATGSATLSVDTFWNTAIAAIATLKCAPTTVVPEGNLRLLNGLGINCEVDGSLAGNMKYYYDDTLPALYFADIWKGTVVFTGYAAAGLDLSYWANNDSVVRLNGVTGYLKPNTAFPYTVELIDNGEAAALNWSNGSSGAQSTFSKLTGTGTFQTTAGGGNNEKVLIKDVSGFTGSFNLAAKNVAIADAMPDDATGSNGRLYVEKEVEISAGKGWAANGGLYLGDGADLAVSGAFATGSTINTYGAGAVLTIEDGGSVKVNGAISGDNAPTLNFKAGMYQITQSIRETKTVNFCAASGKRTVVDANGYTLTLGPNVFAGSGDVYLTSSKAGGKIVVEGISAEYTGTIYCDISCEVSFGDLSKATNCNINVSDVILSRSSSDVGNLTVGLGATLEVTVTKDNQINGCTIDTVTLNDGATMVLKDKTGQVLETFRVEDAVDGKYVLAADPSITAEYLLDYEFNGNMNSVGTDTTGLNIWNGTASYDSQSEKIYMRCKPYINKTFAMPDDEWSVFMRCTLPANSENPTMMLMFGKNGGNVFGLVAGTGENTVALASKDNLIGEAVQVENGTTKQHVYAIVKTANRVRLYVDGELKVDESATVSVSKEFQIGSVKNGNNTSYDPCDDANALIDYMRFYDFAVGQSIIEDEVAEDEDPDPVIDPDATPLEESEGFVTSEYQLAFEDSTLDQLTASTLGGKFSGGWVVNKGKDATFCNFVYGDSIMTCEAQIDGEYDEQTPIIKAICLEFAQVEDDVYVKATEVKWKANSTLGEALTPTYNPGTLATTESANGYGFYNLTLARSGEPAYDGPEPTAIWVSGEFGKTKNGYSIALNGNNEINEDKDLVIKGTSSSGATIDLRGVIPDGTNKVTVVYKYKTLTLPSDCRYGATVNFTNTSNNTVYDVGFVSWNATNRGLIPAWHKSNGGAVSTDFWCKKKSNDTPNYTDEMSVDGGYVILSYDSSTRLISGYQGTELSTATGTSQTAEGLGTNGNITHIGLGGPTGRCSSNKWGSWPDLVIEKVAIFVGDAYTQEDLEGFEFPDADPDTYFHEPAAVWYKDFKTDTKGDYTLSVSGATTIADDKYGSKLTIDDKAAVISIPAPTREYTMIIKYLAAPNQLAQNFFAGGSFTNGSSKVDIGILSTSGTSSALTAGYDNGTKTTLKSLGATLTPSTTGGYLLIAHNASGTLTVATGESFEGLRRTSATITDYNFANWYYTSLAVGGPSGILSQNKNGAWNGLEVEKIAIFDKYYAPIDLIKYPEEADTLSIGAGKTWKFAAGETKTYTNIGTLSSGGTIAVTNASTLVEGTYKLAEWTEPQIMSSGYGRVGTLRTDGLRADLTAELVYGVKAIYLRVYDAAAYAARPRLKVWPYGDSITEGFNLKNTKANYRVLLGQKLTMLGYNVEMVGCYDKIQSASGSFMDVADPSGDTTTIPDAWKWHSAKHGSTLGVTALTSYTRSALVENVDTLSAQVGKPDVVLLLGGINDLSPGFDEPANVFANWTNVVGRLVKDLPDSKIVVTTALHNGPNRTDALDSNADSFNNFVTNYLNNSMPTAWESHVYFVDLCDKVKSKDVGVIVGSNDNLHPDWLGHDQMAEGWLSVITNIYPSVNGTFPSSTALPEVAENELGAAAKEELADYIAGFKLCRTVTPTGNMDTENPYSAAGEGVTENIGKVGYFVEYVRADNNSHKWVWVDMDAFGTTIGDVGLPTANHQKAVTKLHVKSNHNGIEDVAANNDSVEGWIEFSPYDYTGNASGVAGAPLRHGAATGNYTMFDWDDTLYESGTMGSMQVFRKAPATGRPAQVLFAYNNWRDANTEAEFGIGNFAQHFWGGVQTLDYTYTKGLAKMNAGAYSVKRIEIWTKEGTYEGPDPVAVWVAGEFGDDSKLHGGLEFTLNGNTTNELGQIVIGDSTTLGATVAIPSGHSKASVLVKYSIPDGTHADDSVLASMTSLYDLGVLSDSGETTAKGYWYDTRNDANTVTDGSFAFASPAPSIPQEGYLLLSYKNDSETAVYLGATTSTLVGGAKSGLYFSKNDVTKIAVGGPTVAGAKPWAGMVIDSVAIFLDEYLSNSDIAFAEFPQSPIEINAYPINGAIVPTQTKMELSCTNDDVEIWYYNASLNENEADAVTYTTPVVIEAGLNGAEYHAFAKKDGKKVWGPDVVIEYKIAGSLLDPLSPSDILDTPDLFWAVSGDNWAKETSSPKEGDWAYKCILDSAAPCSLKTIVKDVGDNQELTFYHKDSFDEGALFEVLVDGEQVWSTNGAITVQSDWVMSSFSLSSGSHAVEFRFTGSGSTLYLDYISINEKTTSGANGAYPVPYSWIEACFPGIEGQPDAMYETMAKSSGANGYKYWESYALGLEPTDPTSKFTATIRMDGTTPVVEYSPTNTVLEASGAIRYVLQGSSVIKKASDWTEADDRTNMTAAPDDRFFRVKVTW